MPSVTHHHALGLALLAGLGLSAAACTITADDLKIDPGLLDTDIEGQVIRLTLSAESNTLISNYPSAPIEWKVEANGTVLGEGSNMAGEIVDIDATAALAAAADGAIDLQLTAWLDIVGDKVQDALEPATTTSASVEVTGGYSSEYDSSGKYLAIYGLVLTVSGNGGTGTVGAPAELPAHAWTEVSSFTYGKSYLTFTAPDAGRYVFLAESADDTVRIVASAEGELNSAAAWEAFDPYTLLYAREFDHDFAAGEEGLVEVYSQVSPNYSSPSGAVRTYRVMAMRLPAPGDNVAHAVVDSPDWGLGGLEVYDFASVTTAYESANTRYIDGTYDTLIQFARPKVGDELNNPRIVWSGYRFNTNTLQNSVDYMYYNGGGQGFQANAGGVCLARKDGDETDRTDSTPAGTYSAVNRVFTSCKVNSGGFEFNVTAVFQR